MRAAIAAPSSDIDIDIDVASREHGAPSVEGQQREILGFEALGWQRVVAKMAAARALIVALLEEVGLQPGDRWGQETSPEGVRRYEAPAHLV